MGLQVGDKNMSTSSDLTEEVAESFRSGPKIISSSRLNAIVYYACTIRNLPANIFNILLGCYRVMMHRSHLQRNPLRVKKTTSKEARNIICPFVEDFADADVEGMIFKTSQEPSAMRTSLDPFVETTKWTAHKKRERSSNCFSIIGQSSDVPPTEAAEETPTALCCWTNLLTAHRCGQSWDPEWTWRGVEWHKVTD